MTIHVGVRNQVTLPKAIVKQCRLKPGDPVEIAFDGERIILEPQVHIPRSQAYFWTKEWQAAEREADEDIRRGRVHGPFKTVKDLIKSLRSR